MASNETNPKLPFVGRSPIGFDARPGRGSSRSGGPGIHRVRAGPARRLSDGVMDPSASGLQ